MRALGNILGLQAGWFACVFGAAAGLPWLGIVAVAAHLFIHVRTSDRPAEQARFLVFAGALGLTLDSVVALAGSVAFASPWPAISWLSPPWMIALWPNFATAFDRSMDWCRGRPWAAAAIGLVGGPIAYAAGARLGAIELASSWSLLAIAAEWALAMPLLALLSARRQPAAAVVPAVEVAR